MFQQVIAIIIIAFIISRLIWQKRGAQISTSEFKFWLFFWIVSGIAVLNLKYIDLLVAHFGFSGSGIQVLLEVAIVVLFYFIFRLRLRMAKLEKDITRLVENIALNTKI
ncbi:MAG: DUF2304 family protein [bacterium]